MPDAVRSTSRRRAFVLIAAPAGAANPENDLEAGPSGALVILISEGLAASSPLEASWRLRTGIGQSELLGPVSHGLAPPGAVRPVARRRWEPHP